MPDVCVIRGKRTKAAPHNTTTPAVCSIVLIQESTDLVLERAVAADDFDLARLTGAGGATTGAGVAVGAATGVATGAAT